MGLIGNFFGDLLGAGAGVAGAHNAYLAELAIKTLSESEKKRVATEVIEMCVRASGFRQNTDQVCNHFNRVERLCQLNIIALALNNLDIHKLAGDSWMRVRNPFALIISEKDLKISAYYLKNKHKLNVSIGEEQIDIKEWLTYDPQIAKKPSNVLTDYFSGIYNNEKTDGS